MSVHSLSYEIQISLISSSYLLYFFPTLFSKLRKLSDFTITLLHFLLIFTDRVPYKSDRPEYYPCLSATPDKALSICQLKFHHLLEMENKLAEDWRIKTKLKGQLPMHQYIERIKLVLISIYSSSFLFSNENKCLCIVILNYMLSWLHVYVQLFKTVTFVEE